MRIHQVLFERGRLELGPLRTGTSVTFTRSKAGAWGLEIAGPALRISRPEPAKVEIRVGKATCQELVVYLFLNEIFEEVEQLETERKIRTFSMPE